MQMRSYKRLTPSIYKYTIYIALQDFLRTYSDYFLGGGT